MLPNKWHRAWIGAAGMYIEIVIASICTFLWWFSEPGMLNQLCLSTMFVCSVSTVMFNANPLLRYDGYYILADLMEIPNLRQKSSTILNHKLGLWCLGLEEPEDPFLPQRNQLFFALYTVASAVYRWVILFGIIWFLYKVFEPYGLKVISQTLAFVSIASLVAMPMYKLGKFFYVPGRLDKVKRKNVNITLGILGVAALFIILCPLPYRVVGTLELKPRAADPVYAEVPGILEEILVKPGQQVSEGDKLGQMSNIDLLLDINEIESQIAKNKARAQSLQTAQFALKDRSAALELPEVMKSLKALREQLAQRQEDVKRLELIAPSSGTVLPPPEIPARPDRGGDLAKWTGSPLEEKNLGAYMAGDSRLFCQIGDAHHWEAHIAIDQDDIDFVRENQAVAIKLDEVPYRTFYSKISEIGPEIKISSRHLSSKSGGELMSKSDESGMERPINTTFQALAAIDDPDGKLIQGLRGTAKVYANWQPLGQRMWRYLVRTFNFKL